MTVGLARFRGTSLSRLALVVSAGLLIIALAACAPGVRGLGPLDKRAIAPTPNSAPPSHPVVTAFQPSWGDPANITASRHAISVVAITGIDIIDGGAAVSTPTPALLKQVARAHALGLKAEVLLLNYEGGVGFSESVAASMLNSAANRASAAASFAAVITSSHLDGAMFDLESLGPDETVGLVAFAAALRAAVGPSIHLDAAIQASTTAGGYRAMGYDLPGLLRSLDTVTIMGYDQHSTYDPTNPGPVGELTWQRKVLAAALLSVKPEQVDLGVPGYGYRWGPEGAHTVGDPSARTLVAAAGVTPTFDDRRGEWTATLPDGEVLWWADAKSIALREQLAASLGLHGVAVWSLVLSDPVPVAP